MSELVNELDSKPSAFGLESSTLSRGTLERRRMSRLKFADKLFSWSPQMAYAIGLLVTDGNLSSDGRHITMSSVDTEQLETFKQCLQISTRIVASPKSSLGVKKYYRVQWSDVQFYRWLLTVGILPAKTYTIGRLEVPDQFFRDFIRGHLDGDGCITVYKDHYNTKKNDAYVYIRLFVRFISASRLHAEWLRETLERLLGITGDMSQAKPSPLGTVGIWQLKYMKKESLKLLNWMYYAPGIPSLTRKRQKAERTIVAISRIKRKPYVRNKP